MRLTTISIWADALCYFSISLCKGTIILVKEKEMCQLSVFPIKNIGVMIFAGRCISLQMYFLNRWASMLSNCERTGQWWLRADKAVHNLLTAHLRILLTHLHPFPLGAGEMFWWVVADDNWVSSTLHRRNLQVHSPSWLYRHFPCKWFTYCRPTRNSYGLF